MTIFKPSSLNLLCWRCSCQTTILLSYHVYKIFAMVKVLRISARAKRKNSVSLKWRIQQFDGLETEVKLFCIPFSMTPSDVPTDRQLEVIDLQCDSYLNEKLAYVGLEIYKYLLHGYPKLKNLAVKVFCIIGTIYL